MPTYNDIKTNTDSELENLATYHGALLADTEQLKEVNKRIVDAVTSAQTPNSTDTALVTSLTQNITDTKSDINTSNTNLDNHMGEFANLDYKSVLTNLGDDIPILLFPVRVETQFYHSGTTYQLWVRFFPDDVAIETHEAALSQPEIDAGTKYLDIKNSSTATANEKINAWDTLCRVLGHHRAAWAAFKLSQTSYNTKYNTWTQQPHTRVLPDRFVVSLYSLYDAANPVPDVEGITNPIPYSVKVGINPNDVTSLNKTGSDITASDELKWMIDFQEAIDIGMGIKINLTSDQYADGFERVVVLGVKTLTDTTQGKNIVEELIDNHHYVSGFSLLKQATPTKNTEEKTSGYSTFEFGNELTYKIECEEPLLRDDTYTQPENITNVEENKTDGQRLAEALGIDLATFEHIYHADGYDIKNAMTVNFLLYPATVGYVVSTILAPNLDNVSVITYNPYDEVRNMFEEYIRGRGALPSIRVGTQPYGILPITSFKNIVQLSTEPKKKFLDDYCEQVGAVDGYWSEEADLLKYAGAEGQDPQEVFADIIGKHAVSTKYFKRMGVGPAYMWNNLVFNDMELEANQWYDDQQTAAQNFITDTGLDLDVDTFGLQMNYMQNQQLVEQPLIDSLPPSDTRQLETLGDGINYIQWMRNCTVAQLREEDFSDLGAGITAPTALLYVFLRQALLLEYFRAACNLLNVSADERKEYEFINFDNETPVNNEPPIVDNPPPAPFEVLTEDKLPIGQSRWEMFDRLYEGTTVGEYMTSSGFEGNSEGNILTKMKEGMDDISNLPTGELDLLLREHFDICSFRLDSWKLGAMNQRLNYMRLNSDGTVKTQGIYIGAYGWLEDLKKTTRNSYTGPTLPTGLNESGLIENEDNKGYVLAPSQNHAMAAAVLRSGYVAKANVDTPNSHEINLSSERTRMAMYIFDGIRNGQDISTMLGYEFERALHERYTDTGENLDKFIYPLRNKYKLAAGTNTEATTAAIETIAANNVVNGMALLNAYNAAYLLNQEDDNIFTHTNLSLDSNFDISPNNVTNLKKEVNRLNNIYDAVADLATAEGIFHVISGNPDAAGALASSISGGTNPPQAQIVNTPRTGISLTNRITLNIPVVSTTPGYTASTNTAGWPESSVARAIAEPNINNWLKDLIPNPQNIQIGVVYTDGSTVKTKKINLNQLVLQPIDLIYCLPEELVNDDTELSQRIKFYTRITNLDNSSLPLRTTALESTVEITINYDVHPDNGKYSLTEIHALLKYLAKMIKMSRSLKTSDFMAVGSESGIIEVYEVTDFYTRLTSAKTALNNIKNNINTALGYLNNINTSPENLTLYWASLCTEMLKAAAFGIPQTVPATTNNTTAYISELKADAEVALSTIGKRIVETTALILALALPESPNDFPNEVPGYIEKLKGCFKALFGESFNALPLFKFADTEKAVLKAKLASNTLLDDVNSEPFTLDEWQQGVSRVRKKVADFEMMTMLAEGFVDPINFNLTNMVRKPFQFPYNDDGKDRWMAVKVDKENMKADRLCLMSYMPEPLSYYNISTNTTMDHFQAGFVIDDWTEEIPNSEETGGITLHYDQPNAKPPQCLILALPPSFSGSWNWDNLFNTMNEALDEAKKRGVEYSEAAKHPIGQITPALVIPSSGGQMTIGLTI